MKLLSTLFPQDEFIGIHIGYQNIYMTIGKYSPNAIKVEWQKVFSYNEIVDFNKVELKSYLENINSAIPEEFKKRYLPVQIALPDSLFKTQKLQFSNFPRSYKEQSTLVNWQLAKASHCDVAKIYTTWQMLRQENAEQTVFAYGLDKNIIDTVKAEFNKTGLHVSSINAASYYRYNILGAEALRKSGVLIALENDYWSLMFWDDAGYINHIHTALRDHKTHDDIPNIVADTERLVMSYVLKENSVENIYITAVGEEKDLLQTEINQHLEHGCKWLSIAGVSTDNFYQSGIVDLATIIKP